MGYFSIQTITALVKVVTGGSDSGDRRGRIGIYRTGSQLELFLGTAGIELHIGDGSRIPSVRTAVVNANENDSNAVIRLIEQVADPQEYLSCPEKLKAVVEYLNVILREDSYELVRIDEAFKLCLFPPTEAVAPATEEKSEIPNSSNEKCHPIEKPVETEQEKKSGKKQLIREIPLDKMGELLEGKGFKERVFYNKYPIRDGYSTTNLYPPEQPAPELKRKQIISEVHREGKFQKKVSWELEQFPSEILDKKQKQLVHYFTGEGLGGRFLGEFLRQHCNVPNPETMTWEQIIAALLTLAKRNNISLEEIEQYPEITWDTHNMKKKTPDESAETKLKKTIMLDGKILDRARCLILARIKKRQRLFPDELSSKLRGLQLSGNHPIESSRGKKIIRNFFTEELENRAPIIWESLQQAHEASGSQLTETLAFDLKEAATQFLSEITKELSEFMMKQPGFTKDDIAKKPTLDSTKNDACEKIDIKIDLYVNSLTNKTVETERDTKSEREGMIEPKPPEFLAKTLWILKHGRKNWKLLVFAGLIFLMLFVFSRINPFAKKPQDIHSESKTTGDNSPIIIDGDYVEGDKIIKQGLSEADLEYIVTELAEKLELPLAERYPTAHTVFGVYQDRDVIPMGLTPENLEIDWKTGKVQSINNNILEVTLPDITLSGKLFVGGNKTLLAKRVGAKTKPIIKIGWFNPILEVIGIDDKLVVVALGFPADDSKKQ